LQLLKSAISPTKRVFDRKVLRVRQPTAAVSLKFVLAHRGSQRLGQRRFCLIAVDCNGNCCNQGVYITENWPTRGHSCNGDKWGSSTAIENLTSKKEIVVTILANAGGSIVENHELVVAFRTCVHIFLCDGPNKLPCEDPAQGEPQESHTYRQIGHPNLRGRHKKTCFCGGGSATVST
jgi:hypothetical protein